MLTKVSAGVLNIDDLYGFRNRIINGDMRIDQRNAGAAVTVVSAGFAVDRFRQTMTSDFATVASQRDSDAPAGFVNSLKWTVQTPATANSNQQVTIRQKIEGHNVADFKFGSSGSEVFTLSFWVKSSVAGIYCVAFRNNSEIRTLIREYTISSADTWEYKTITGIPKDTTGTWNRTTDSGLEVHWDLGSGPDRTNSQTNVWLAAGLLRTSNQVNWINTSGATFYITGVQLEAGSVATPFERRPFGTELALCQRYYFKWVPVELGNDYAVSFNPSTTTARGTVPFPVSMRTGPSALEQSGTATDYSVRHGASVTNCSSVPTYAGGTTLNAGVLFTVASGLTAGQGSQLRNNNGTAGYLAWSAEL